MDSDLKWFLGFIGVFVFLWIAGGGFNRKSTTSQPFIKPLTESGSMEYYGEDFAPSSGNSGNSSGDTGAGSDPTETSGQNTQKELDRIQEEINKISESISVSPLKGKISIQSINSYSYGNTDQEKANSEYLTLSVVPNLSEKILITGMRLRSSSTGNEATIGNAVILPFPGIINSASPVYASSGETVYVVTGRSPLGYSFLLNKCAGYFNQFQSFTPSFYTYCPLIRNERLPQKPNALNDACLDYIESVGSCQTVSNPPAYLSHECQTFLINNANYNSCIENHKNDGDFYQKDWRIYLGRSEKLWKDRREKIELLDQNGKVVSNANLVRRTTAPQSRFWRKTERIF